MALTQSYPQYPDSSFNINTVAYFRQKLPSKYMKGVGKPFISAITWEHTKKWKVTGFLGGSKFCPLLQSIQWASSCSRSLHCQCYRQSNPSPGQSHHGKAVPISEPVNVTSQGKKDLEIGKFLWSFRVGGFQSQGCLEVKSLSQR